MAPPETLDEAIERLDSVASENAALAETNDALSRELKILRQELQALRLGLFGRRSERLNPDQLALFEQGQAIEDPVEESTTPAPVKKSKPGHGRADFSDLLPREVIEIDLPEDERTCPCCGVAMQLIGEETVNRGHIVPAKMIVRHYVKKKYACPAGHAVKTAKAPEGVIERAKYEASVYAHVTASKYADHLPLHRLEGIFKRQGVHLPKQTMWEMLVTVDELMAQPILEQMKRELLQEPVLHSDETPVTMRLEEGKGTRTGYAWAWRNLTGVGESKVLVEFRQSRSRDGPLGFLGDWSGTLISDGYSGYDEVVRTNGIVRAGCLAHARRKLKTALETGSKAAVRALRPIQRLFWIERAVLRRAQRDGLDRTELVELRGRVRERRSRVAWEWLYREVVALLEQPSTLPKSKLGKALGYLDRQRGSLSTFLSDPRIPMHNNDTERDLRHLAVGRKNWLVFGSPRGGDVACRLYSLMLSCKQAGVDPEVYIEDVLGKVGTTPHSQIASLTPWGWQAARQAAAQG